MSIQWYPGHMAKAKRQVSEQLNKVDIVIELADARIPFSSRNPMLEEMVGNKPRLIALTKSDMADAAVTDQWIQAFQQAGFEAAAIHALKNKGAKPIVDKAKQLTAPMFEKMARKGIRKRAIRAMVVGIPNVGKSTVINRLVGRKSAKTGDTPGVTKAQQWLKVGNDMELLDTPGILWPKFDPPVIGYRLAATGAIKDEILDAEEVALFTLNVLKERYPKALKERYRLDDARVEGGMELFDEIGRKRGCLQAGGYIDYEKAADIILSDLRTQKFGRVTLETPQDMEDILQETT
ncbi:ribosome biogenesis GTPase A [Alteribacillus persepolensis]|uniref:Ribosome biogenesis GTPase A n=1 Tax=Alteribacillus persepolensis TaxID=568899 RepID=A0A1G7YLK3_9BACI|nr:ribosome biogenesis GTPase YlqF [Alteribacillus persepolensis]SDG97226.1 ribosome biogenesis GTPase A [Alteribacillus persepolensis]